MSATELRGWDWLRHGGLLLDPPRLRRIAVYAPGPLPSYDEHELRKHAGLVLDGGGEIAAFVAFVLERICGLGVGSGEAAGTWQRGSQIGAEWGRRTVTGETVKPRHLWRGQHGAILAVFIVDEPRVGIGRGRKSTSQVLQWLRAGAERLALLTNGRQWRLLFATLDIDAWCEWDADLWFEEGALSPQVDALRTLLQPALWTPMPPAVAPLVEAILDSRKGQAELSAVLGERAREAVELLVQGHGEALKEHCPDVDPADIYRAAVRVVMRMVVVLFAESRDLLPQDSALYHGAYGLGGLLEELEKVAARGGQRLARSWSAWPRMLALFRLVHQGSHHQALPVPEYGGELFAPGDPAGPDGVSRALAVLEGACFAREILPDRDVHRILERITRTRLKLRQGRTSTWMPAPVDFSDLSTEYIGILYEGLLDFELRTAPAGDPVVFLAVGNQPALPLSRLEAMDDRALADLLEKMKDTSSPDENAGEEGQPEDDEGGPRAATADGEEEEGEPEEDEPAEREAGDESDPNDERHATRTRAERWARRAVVAGKLVGKPRGALTPERKLALEDAVARKARQLVTRVVLPGEWYLVRWGGTRKGSGTFYTRPGLAVPTVQRTLRPLAYTPPSRADGTPDLDAPPAAWTPKTPEEILALKVCDPGCGSGTFPVAALRFLTEAVYASLHHHGRITADGDRAVVHLLAGPSGAASEERLVDELLPCRPDDPTFEPRLKAILRRHVVERCIYGVDLDPLAVELCRLALWVETMDRTLPFSFLDHKIKCGNSLVGAWFDQFQHYPVMAWKNREGGDKNHTNGVHFQKEQRTKAIKEFVSERLTPDLRERLSGQMRLFSPPATSVGAVHDDALALLERLHELPVQDTALRARIYREELVDSPAFRSLKDAMDLWCACWFWPADELEHAPLPSSFATPPTETRVVAQRIAASKRFFHWELEFPDVFSSSDSGFDANLGNPPWDIAKPSSKEFFSNIDPLYRAYGKQEALGYQTVYFGDQATERAWLDYSADFRAQSNFLAFAASPYGDPTENETSQDRFTIQRGKANDELHALWRQRRNATRGYADRSHPYRHQGAADVNLYKAFLEQGHALLRHGGRLGFIVPSGLYSDHGTGGLRRLFLDRCRWEWLFGFENREGIFEIHRSYKFNPVIVEKGGSTAAIRTAFMRRKLEDWERAEEFATLYTREQVDRFSPRSKAILEIQSARDLEILEKIYANSVLLGDDGPDGWGITYATEFHMTNDSKLFPPRPKWEADGYRPDEYSRWLKGDWRPIEELWAELAIDPLRVVPIDPACEADIAARSADVQRTGWHLRCAQPPYDTLPICRADIPAGIILSRDAGAWIREDRIADTALPLYEGRMVSLYDFTEKGWVSGKGRKANWRPIPWASKRFEHQYLMARQAFQDSGRLLGSKLGFLAVGSGTNTRSMYCSFLPDLPCGNSVGVLRARGGSWQSLALLERIASLLFDWVVRLRLTGVNLNYFVIEEAPLPPTIVNPTFEFTCARVALPCPVFSSEWARHLSPGNKGLSWKSAWALTPYDRSRLGCMLEAVVLADRSLTVDDAKHIVAGCDYASPASVDLSPKGFWRVDKEKDPELRQTVLTFVAFHDLDAHIGAYGGDRDKGIEAFLAQNDGEGWMLPETLCLADYGLGHDGRAKEHQPVASRLGPRFYDWQLAQSAEESWRECHLHARNLLGAAGYRQLLAELEQGDHGPSPQQDREGTNSAATRKGQMRLFE